MSRDRDHKLELALKHELRAAGTPDRDACADAETLGAWADGGLQPAQMASIESHVSSCARCQAIVGVAARSAPAPAVSASVFRFPRWALAPLAAAAAVTLWMVVPQDSLQAPPAPPAAVAPERDAPEQRQAKANEAAPAAPPAADNFQSDAKRERANQAPAPPREDRSAAERERTPDSAVADTLAEKVTAGAVAAAPAGAPAPTATAQPALPKSARLASAAPVIVSPDPSSRWRIVNDSIERSEDGGVSWVPIRAPGGESISGGTSPARSVCWLIGASGLVMVTADGVAFARVPLPERIDVTAISATDARSATVTTADGGRFRTEDSGRTWRRF